MVEETVIQKILTKNQLDEATKVSLFSGGQINSVYQIGEALVLKVENELDVTPHQPEIMSLALLAGVKVPKILDFGQIDGKRYLLMSKIFGRKLSEDWFSFSDEQKENLIRQIVEQLKIFHSIGFAKYSSRRPNEFDNWETAIDWLTNLDRIEVIKLPVGIGRILNWFAIFICRINSFCTILTRRFWSITIYILKIFCMRAGN